MKKFFITLTGTILSLALLVAPINVSYTDNNGTKHRIEKSTDIYLDNIAGVITEDTTHVEGLDDDVLAAVITLGDTYADMQEYMVELINEERAAAGVDPVVLDKDLCTSATYRSAHMCMKNYFSHYYNKKVQSSIIHQAVCGEKNYKWLGENIFSTQSASTNLTEYFTYNELAERAINGFHNSKSHYDIMVKTKAKKVGIGIFFSEDMKKYYVTQIYSD